jgi:hypothetical protein
VFFNCPPRFRKGQNASGDGLFGASIHRLMMIMEAVLVRFLKGSCEMSKLSKGYYVLHEACPKIFEASS